MTPRTHSPGLRWLAILLVGLALSIGWGVRGQWGHEYGAAIPGAMAAIAAVLVSGREDWYRRVPFFAFFGALGWSFGGSMSYMQVISYTHSGHAASVAYGFACLFVLGFLWAAVGGAGTAWPAYASRERLTESLFPFGAALVAWAALDLGLGYYLGSLRAQLEQGTLTRDQLREQLGWMNWYDTDWIGVSAAGVALLVQAALRRRLCWGSQLGLTMVAGWWLGFLILTVGLHLRMTPPRGDNWSGALGMTAAMFVFLIAKRELEVAWAALVVGFFGGLGFSGATIIKLVLVQPEFQQRVFGGPTSSNWHSILEQSFGFISGVGVALAMGYLSTRSPRQSEQPLVRRWAEPLCVAFIVLPLTYVNIFKNLDAVWLKPDNQTVPPEMWGHSAQFWFNLAYLALAVTILWPLVAWYRGRTLAVLPGSALGKSELFFIIFLWWIVMGNLARAVPFQPQRLITEGVIHLNACLCTLLAILLPAASRPAEPRTGPDYRALLRATAIGASLATALVIGAEFGLIRWMWGDTFAGHANLHIRFGPDATLDKK